MNSQDWSSKLIANVGDYLFKLRGSLPEEMPSFKAPPHFGFVNKVMESLTRVFLEIPKGLREPIEAEREYKKYQLRHHSIILEMAEEIRSKRKYQFFLDFLRAIEQRFNLPFPLYIEELKEVRPTFPSFLLIELLIFWVLMEKDGRYLVCVREGHQRKAFPLPENPKDRMAAILQIGLQILTVLPFITPQHLDLIPERFGPIYEVDRESMRVPVIINQTIDEVLEDAYFHQRYLVHPEGAIVQFKNAFDIKEMLAKVVEGKVIAKISISQGQTVAVVDLETAQGIDFTVAQQGPLAEVKNALSLLVASVYHDLVIRIEAPARKKRKYASLMTEREKTWYPQEEPTFIYIPRKIRVGGEIREVSPRISATFHRPPRIHQVRGYLRRGRMTEHHRKVLEEFEKVTGLRILERIPAGFTFVRPYISPMTEGPVIAQYPRFIKTKIEAGLFK